MKPLYINCFNSNFNVNDIFNSLKNEINWEQKTDNRLESFMSHIDRSYTYGSGNGIRTYNSIQYHPIVKLIQDQLNSGGFHYNVCFLNYYRDCKDWLGWHSDDSPEMDANHPIAVVSFGTPRYIYWRKIGEKGLIPDDNKQLLASGSLFVMPKGFQSKFEHKIPKYHKQEGGERISLTFRSFLKTND